MKKLIFFLTILITTIAAQAQTWDSYYSTLIKDSLAANSDVLFIVEDLSDNAAYVLNFKSLDSLYLKTANAGNADTIVWLLSDTIVLGSFGKDTTRTTDFYGSFYNGGSDTLVVTEMRAVLQGTSPSVTVDVQWHATFNSGSATHLNTTPPTITSTTTGNSDTSFNNAEIPPGVFVWMETPTVTTPATYISVTLMGYRKNRSY